MICRRLGKSTRKHSRISEPTQSMDMLERGCADEDYRDIRKFLREVGRYLKLGGMVVFGFSESGDLSLLETLIADNGFRIKRKLSEWRQDYNCMLFVLVRDPKICVNGSFNELN